MAFVKVGSLTVAANTTAQNLNLGFFPDYFMMTNITNVVSPVNDEIVKAEWYAGMADDTGIGTNYTASQPAIEINNIVSGGFTPFQTPDNLLFVPNQAPYNSEAGNRAYIGTSTLLVITGISNAVEASVTATHSFTSADIGVTVVTFHGVLGMTEINTLRGTIQSVTSTTSFTVNINTSNFGTYVAGVAGVTGGFANVITGAPASTLYSNVYLPTAQANLGQIGLTLGTTLMTVAGDVWRYVAMLDTPANA